MLCAKNSNWKEVLNDETEEMELENCIVFTTMAKSEKLSSIDIYSEVFLTKEVVSGEEIYKLKNKEKITLNEKSFIKAIYSAPSNKEHYDYITMSSSGKIITFYIITDPTYISIIEKILSTLSFKPK